jgi:kynurenine formamidase
VNQADIRVGGFVFFRTGWSEFAATGRYYDHPELSPEVVEWLISKEVGAVGIDALGLGRGRRHGEYDRRLAAHDIHVIENLANLAAIPQERFKVYCLPLKIEDTDAIPARVLVEIEDND